MLGQYRSPSLVQCRSIVYDAGPILFQHWVCCILCAGTSADTCHSPNAVSMLNYSLRRWPSIKIALDDCPVFAGVLPHCNAGDALLPRRRKGYFPNNTIHWPNADVIMGHRLLRWANINPTKTLESLITNIIVNIIVFQQFLKTQLSDLATSNVIFDMLIRTGVQKCQLFPTHSTPFPLNRTQTKLNRLLAYGWA